MQQLWQFDQSAFRAIHLGLHQDWLDPFFWVVSSTGLGWVQLLVVLIPPVFLSRKLKELEARTVRTFFRAAVASWKDPVYLVGPLLSVWAIGSILSTVVIKKSIERERPSLFAFARPQEGFEYNSFPSGHTTTSFAIAFMLLFVSWKTPRWWVGPLGLAWASLVGFSRIYRGVHWPTDVLGGVCCGLIAASITYLLMRRTADAVDAEATPETAPSP
ncbi:MAG TPA: phosphatase PAP2 family protein [Fimbriimonas sp.]